MLKSAVSTLVVCVLFVAACSSGGSKSDAGSSAPDAGPPPGYIAGGTFQMGSATGFPDEQPVTTVTLNPYVLDLTEVRTSDYAQCVSAGKCTAPGLPENGWCNWGVTGKESDPINCVSFEQAQSYCSYVGKRLPTEAEWEFAARGTDGRTYPWGNDNPPPPSEDSMLVRWGPGLGFTTAPVGTHPLGVGPFGHQDLAGNVWEWVEDEYRTYPGGSVTNPLHEETYPGFPHVARGGSWIEGEGQLRTTARMQSVPRMQNTIVGFRCASHVPWGAPTAAPMSTVSFFVVKERTGDSVTLSWDSFEGADAIVLNAAPTPDSATPTVTELPATSTSYKVMGAYTGTATFYSVQLRIKGALGPPSRVLNASPLAPTPTGLKVTSNLARITVTWDESTAPIRGYELYRDGQDWTPTGVGMTTFSEAAGARHTYAVAALGPDLFPGPTGTSVSNTAANVASVVAGNDRFCALGEDKTAWCWGRNVPATSEGVALTAARVPGPGNVGYLDDVKEIAPGGNFTCALTTDGKVWCWGVNDKGQLGDGTTTASDTPVAVHALVGSNNQLEGVEHIAAGSTHTCVIKTSGGAVWCWGDNANSALGGGSFSSSYRSTPLQVVGAGGTGTLSGATSLSVGAWSACVTKANNSVWCWGYNGTGGLGDNQPNTNGSGENQDRAYAVQVVGVDGTGTLAATTVNVGLYRACATGTDGVVYCWGSKAPGDSSVNDLQPINQRHYWGVHSPVATPDLAGSGLLSGLTGIGSRWQHTCGVAADGFLNCWGENTHDVLLDMSAGHPWPSVSTQGGFTAIAPGTEASCAILNGIVQCWGTNSAGQLGDGTTTSRDTPAPVLFAQ
jgi:formylglycine-generating enzyme required for sulfatase activity/alpha-tubulin suppressor-like RCC1 family protein